MVNSCQVQTLHAVHGNIDCGSRIFKDNASGHLLNQLRLPRTAVSLHHQTISPQFICPFFRKRNEEVNRYALIPSTRSLHDIEEEDPLSRAWGFVERRVTAEEVIP
jgi:hypothetical protein